ncbi:MAG: DNA (cytosine-5-)-methyltransferase [Desulfovibrio sp.]|jgi:DNA (cytosine-5)-methyltransferase 1|nr:DNA (cytosine-5-)-methyltransferase [Desulfovibrio sp.]
MFPYKDITTLSLFSGCGGMDFGAEEAGANIIWSNELDQDAVESLHKYFPNVDLIPGDIAKVDKFPKAELLIGGYPCQSFSMGGNRNPAADARTKLYLQFARCLEQTNPLFFIAENVSGLQKIQSGSFLQEQVRVFKGIGKHGYRITAQVVDAKEYGVPQTRKRLFIVGIRRDLGLVFEFPQPTHGKATKKTPRLLPFTSHGEAIRDLPLWPTGEFYERPHDPEGHMSWYYMSRNRKANWFDPSYTICANWRHTTLHPGSQVMTLTWSNLADGWKQRWDFSDRYEHLEINPELPFLKVPRRLSWRECARIQTFPKDFEPVGKAESKFNQIGNAVPPLLAKVIVEHLLSGRGVMRYQDKKQATGKQLIFWDNG